MFVSPDDEMGHHHNLHDTLSTLTIRNCLRIYRVASFVKCVPFELSSEKCLEVRRFEENWKIGIWYFVNLIIFSCLLFQFVSFYALISRNGFTGETAVHSLYISVYLTTALFFGCMIWKSDEAIMLINQINFLVQLSPGFYFFFNFSFGCTKNLIVFLVSFILEIFNFL